MSKLKTLIKSIVLRGHNAFLITMLFYSEQSTFGLYYEKNEQLSCMGEPIHIRSQVSIVIMKMQALII